MTIILEPMAQIALSPNVKADANIPNEDSLVFTYDETNLFDADKFPGYDLYDGGARLNVGGRATIDWGGGRDARFLLGRTLAGRATPTSSRQATGLNHTGSDWVVAGHATPIAGLSVFGRALLGDEYGIDRLEVGVDFAYDRFRGYVRYDIDNTIPAQVIDGIHYGGKVDDIEYGGEVFVTPSTGASVSPAFATSRWPTTGGLQRDFGVIYKDDCIRVEVVYQHEDTSSKVNWADRTLCSCA